MRRNHRIHGPIPGAFLSLLLISTLALPMALAGDETAASTEAKVLPDAETILENALEATGGRKAIKALSNRHTTGTMEIPMANLKGSFKSYEAAPNMMSMTVELAGVGTINNGTNGVEAWELSMMGPQLKTGEQKEIAIFRAQFNGELRWKERYSSVEVTGTDSVGDRSCYLVVMTPKVGRPETRCYDAENWDLLRLEIIEVSAMGEIPATAVTSDYREVDGVRVPFSLVQSAMGQEIRITLETVEHNVDLPEGVFDPPPAIRELLAMPAAPTGAAEAEAPAEGP